MPDIVHNDVLVMGKRTEDIDCFIDSVRGLGWDGNCGEQALTFHSIKPVPGGSSWYDTWGTKWDARFDDGDGTGSYRRFAPGEKLKEFHCVQYEFDTARTAPWKIFDALKAKFPALEFYWRCKGEMIDVDWSSKRNACLVRPTLWDMGKEGSTQRASTG